MNQKELTSFAEKLVCWYAEGCEISREIDEENDYYEVAVKDLNGITTYQEFNYYLGNKLWNIYLKKLGEYHYEKFPIDN